MNNFNNQSSNSERSERGRQNYQEGYLFEEKVAEIYRLMHYEVVHGRLFAGRQVDLFLTNRLGDLTIYRAIECKAGTVKSDDIDSFIAKLRLVRIEYPYAQGTIISGTDFTDAVSAHAAAEGIQLTLFRDLAAQLLDGHAYSDNLIKECHSNSRYPINLYIEPLIGYQAVGPAVPAFTIVDEWLKDVEWNQLTLLGDVGTGKSFLSRMIAYRLATKFSQNPITNPLPILIDLRNAERQFSLEGLVLTHFAQAGLSRTTFDIFQHALTNGNLVLILDGFDEMAARVTRQVTNRNFHELMRCIQGRAKVLLTCRTHYFKSRTEEEEVILGSKQDYASETARDLYWELIARKGFKIAYLRPFEISQIEEYVRRAKPDTAKEALKKIRDTYNLMELSQRPMLLEMIVKSIDALNAPEINATTLYEIFTDAWIHRDKWRDVLSPEAKRSFLTALALSLWIEDAPNIHCSRLFDYLHQELAKHIQDEREFIEIDSEIRTASFLVRDDSGNYGFAHKSYAEFFLARHIANELKVHPFNCLDTRRITPEIVHFLRNMVDIPYVESLLESILCHEYRPRISENALICLYGFRRQALISEQDGADLDSDILAVSLPENMDLQGAQLEQVSLEGAELRGADFRQSNLSEAIFSGANLHEAILTDANLEKANLSNTVLVSADLSYATLNGCNLENANLYGADLSYADLVDSFLIGSNLEDANLDGASLRGAALPNILKLRIHANLSEEDLPDDLKAGKQTITEKYWDIIERFYPEMLRIAKLFSVVKDVEPEDIVSELVVILVSPQHIDRLVQMRPHEQHDYLYDSIMRTASRLALVRDRAFGKGVLVDADDGISEIEDEDLQELEVDEEDLAILGIDEEEIEAEYLERLDKQIVVEAAQEEKDETEKFEVLNIEPYVEMIASSSLGHLENMLAIEMQEILSPHLWNIVRAKYVYGYDLDDIAQQEADTKVNIQRQLVKAKEILRRHFKNLESANG